MYCSHALHKDGRLQCMVNNKACDPSIEPIGNWKCVYFSLLATAQYSFLEMPTHYSAALWGMLGMLYGFWAECDQPLLYGPFAGAAVGIILANVPPQSKWVLLGILYFAYIVMAWFDYLTNCERKLGLSYLAHLYLWAKPQGSEQVHLFYDACDDVRHDILFYDRAVALSTIAFMSVWVNSNVGLPQRFSLQ